MSKCGGVVGNMSYTALGQGYQQLKLVTECKISSALCSNVYKDIIMCWWKWKLNSPAKFQDHEHSEIELPLCYIVCSSLKLVLLGLQEETTCLNFQWCLYPLTHKSWVPMFCMELCNICGPSVWMLLPDTLLGPRILKLLLHFCKICAPLH
jgi:hypothetical protein